LKFQQETELYYGKKMWVGDTSILNMFVRNHHPLISASCPLFANSSEPQQALASSAASEIRAMKLASIHFNLALTLELNYFVETIYKRSSAIPHPVVDLGMHFSSDSTTDDAGRHTYPSCLDLGSLR
jgi:hypothetical protein